MPEIPLTTAEGAGLVQRSEDQATFKDSSQEELWIENQKEFNF